MVLTPKRACTALALLLICACADTDTPTAIGKPETITISALFEAAISDPAGAIGATGARSDVYVAFKPGELPGVVSLRIRNRTSGSAATAPYVVEIGALDPVAVPGMADDLLELELTKDDGRVVLLTGRVPARRAPRVIRTDPQNQRTGVAATSSLLVVFSEPIHFGSAGGGAIQLRAGTRLVPGTLTLIGYEGYSVQFAPDAALEPDDLYTLVTNASIRDRQGDPLQRADTAAFRVLAWPGRILATTVTSGTDLDLDGYSVEIATSAGPVSRASVSSSGTATAPVPQLGAYTVTLEGVAENCLVREDAVRRVEVLSHATLTIDFQIVCAPATQLAFVRDGQIYLVNSNGSGLVKLTDTGSGVWNGDPAWSPDGRRIAFTSNRAGPADLYVMNADGSNVVRYTDTGALNSAPAWSPTGDRIAFSSLRAGQFGIYVMSAVVAGASATRLGFDRGYNVDPAWSPDGRTITFVSDWRAFDFVYDLYRMNADGSEVKALVEGPFTGNWLYFFQPAWSPDGQKFAAVSCPRAWHSCYPDSTLEVISADGTQRTALARPGGFANPTWSRDGRTLAFSATACETCPVSIRFVRTEGKYQGLIITNGHSPSWRP